MLLPVPSRVYLSLVAILPLLFKTCFVNVEKLIFLPRIRSVLPKQSRKIIVMFALTLSRNSRNMNKSLKNTSRNLTVFIH